MSFRLCMAQVYTLFHSRVHATEMLLPVCTQRTVQEISTLVAPFVITEPESAPSVY